MQKVEELRAPEQRLRIVFDNILFATDCSPSSEVALRYALALAHRYDGRVYAVHAATMDADESVVSEAKQKALQAARPVALSCARDLRESGQLKSVRHEILIGEEDAATVNLPKSGEFDLVVSGVGYREKQATVLAPAVEEAIRRSQCPALSVSPAVSGHADGELKSVLFATDFSPESLEASRYAVSLAQEYQARLTLLHVVEQAEPQLLDEKSQMATPFKLWLGKLVPDEARLWCDLEFTVEFGRPAERILQAAWENHADLIVLGARGFGRMTSPGLNVTKVMSNALCPVLTVSGVLDGDRQKRFWRAAAAAWESQGGVRIADGELSHD
jgi:nucleotide-binding universal stress UspA family protein